MQKCWIHYKANQLVISLQLPFRKSNSTCRYCSPFFSLALCINPSIKLSRLYYIIRPCCYICGGHIERLESRFNLVGVWFFCPVFRGTNCGTNSKSPWISIFLESSENHVGVLMSASTEHLLLLDSQYYAVVSKGISDRTEKLASFFFK
jgi:hypothetical protein